MRACALPSVSRTVGSREAGVCAIGRVWQILSSLTLRDPRGCQALAVPSLVNERMLERCNLMIEQIVRLMNEANHGVRHHRRILMVQPRGVRAKNINLPCPIGPISLIGLISLR